MRVFNSLYNQAIQAVTEEGFVIGSRVHGYVIKRVKKIPEFSLTAIELEHEKTSAKHLHLSRSDDNVNSFCVSFRTTPKDDTGVAHILEHLSLCGSKKYPCRDPFMKMLSRSVATFMNACTGFDVTYYPFSTPNIKDYENLMNVYLDATYFPLFSDTDFLQEAWRLEHENLQDLSSPIQLKGVVLNEMKDVYGSASNIFELSLVQQMLPETIYKNEFGGHPFSIPDLTNEQVKAFHQAHYHPTNAKFYTYGDQPLEFYLSRINNVLSKFERNEKYRENSNIALQKHWQESKEVNVTCPPELFAENSDKQITTCLAYLLTNVTDTFENFTLSILSSLLVDSQNSPFYESLIASNLGKDYSPGTGFLNWAKQSFFSVGLQGIDESQIAQVEEIVNNTFNKVINEGFAPERIEAILHSIELSLKHQTSSFGLNLINSLNTIWNHDGDEMEALQLNNNIQKFRQALQEDPNFLTKKVKQYFLNNKHKLKLTMRPNANYTEEFKAELDKVRQRKLAKMSADDLKKNHEACLKLAQKMNEKQDVSVLPCLNVNTDIKKELPQKTKVSSIQLNSQTSVQVSAQNTNQLTYFRALAKLDLSKIPEDLISHLPLLCSLLSQLGAGDLDRKQLSHETEMNCSGLNASLFFKPDYKKGVNFDLNVLFSSYCLNEKLEKTLDLWTKIFNELRFDDHQHIAQLIRMGASNASQSIVSSGHSYAALRSSHNINPLNNLKEKLEGVTYISELNKIAQQEQFDETISKLKKLAKIVFDRKNLKFALNTEESNIERSLKVYEKFLNQLPTESGNLVNQNLPIFDATNNLKEHYVMPFNSNYVSQSILAVPFLHPDHSKYQIISRLLSRKYLHPEIREKGSAYGSGLRVESNGVMTFFSYRDPNLSNTLDVFSKSFDWLANENNYNEQDVNEAKLGLFKDLDKPIMPGNHGLAYFLNGITDEMLDKYRKSIFTTQKSEIFSFIKQNLPTFFTKSGIAVLGPESEQTKTGNWKHLKE